MIVRLRRGPHLLGSRVRGLSRKARAVGRPGRTAARRSAGLAVLAAICSLGFFQASALVSRASVARQALPPSTIINTPTIIQTLPTTTTTTTATPTILTVVPLPITVFTISTSSTTSTSSTPSTAATLTTAAPVVTTPVATAPVVTAPVTPTPAPADSLPSDTTTGPPVLPVIVTEPATTTTKYVPPPVPARLAVAVSGAGTVTGTGISCGAKASKCFGSFNPGTKVTLHAEPSAGNTFAGWSGGCKGVSPVCLVSLSKASDVGAGFARQVGASIPVSISRAKFDVKWAQSLGTGRLDVRGKIAKPAQVALQLHRSGGSRPLLTTNLSLPAGPFSLSIKLLPGLLADGAPLLPGGFVVSISGHGGKVAVPTQVRTIRLAAPPQGVVSKAFASSSAGGAPDVSIPAGRKAAFVHFVFQTMPTAKQRLSIAWYRPGGKLLGVVTKSIAPVVTSSITSKAPIPAGSWRVDLRAGNTVVKSIPVVVS